MIQFSEAGPQLKLPQWWLLGQEPRVVCSAARMNYQKRVHLTAICPSRFTFSFVLVSV